MVSLLIGPNDFCLDMCYYTDMDVVVRNHERDLTATLRILRDNLPKTFVQVILSPCKSPALLNYIVACLTIFIHALAINFQR